MKNVYVTGGSGLVGTAFANNNHSSINWNIIPGPSAGGPDFLNREQTFDFFSKNKIVINSSNKNFNKVLEGKEIETIGEETETADFKNLYYDVFDMDIDEKDTVRLSASTIDQLFKDENYNLKDIRKNKLVKPINIDLLPAEIKSIENTRKEKSYLFKLSYL